MYRRLSSKSTAVDQLLLEAVVREWAEQAQGARVEKVIQPASAMVVLSLRARDWKGRLLLSAEAGWARAHLTQESLEAPERPPGFCQALRAAIKGARLGRPELLGGDRVVALPFERQGELEATLVGELTGRQAALVLVRGPLDEGQVVALAGQGGGRLTRGRGYEPPAWPEGSKLASDYEAEELAEALSRPETWARPLERRLVNLVMGLSPTVARELCFRVGLGLDARAVSSREARALLDEASSLLEEVRRGRLEPRLYRDRSGAVIAATPVRFFYLEEQARAEPAPSANHAAEALAEARVSSQRALQLRERLESVLGKALSRARRKAEKIRQELARADEAEQHRRFGELILAHLGEIGRGASSVTLRNDFDPEGREITIELDPSVSAQVNAARYFKRSRKARRSREALEGRLKEAESEVAYLEATRQAASRADEEEAEGLLEELAQAGFISEPKPQAPRRKRQMPIRRFRAAEGWEVLVGKNARGNDELTTRLARPQDLWFHAQDLPGAHVLLRGETRGEPPEEAVGWAAAAAAYFSRGRSETRVRVLYTEARHVTKPKGAKPGQVFVRKARTLLVAPARAESLLSREMGGP